MSERMLRVSGIVEESIVDGPGYRFTVFTQGCLHGCPGCHNPQTHDFAGGQEMDTEEIIARFRADPLLDGITLTGGDPFCAEAVGEYPAPVYVYDTLESSNRTAKLLALDGAPHGTLVLTAHQKAGRGRLGRRFESPAGKGVYLSLILRPALSAADAQSATISAAVAVARAVKALCGLELGIKWVNDLYYQGRKVCGILTEAGTDMESGQLEWLVVGIGLNLITSPADWPEELARTAGSLYPGGPAPVSRAVLAGAIARELLSLCPAFDCLDEYRARCFVPGHWVTVCTGAETYAAKALSIDDAGRLVVEREGGRQIALQHGEVSIRPTSTI